MNPIFLNRINNSCIRHQISNPMKRMLFMFHVIVMSSAFFNPSFAFSSHFDTDGAPLSELSWPSSLAVVAVSFSGLFTFVFLMLACLCCKKGDIGFKEFENADGEDHQADLSALASPSSSSQNGPEVYILPLTEVSLPVSQQPGRSIQLLKSSDLGRHSLLYLKEIGHGWFGKVLLGEVNAGLSTTQVVVKELKASASVQDQMQFLEEAQPYLSLHHPTVLQCLAQCSEVTPYLLVMEFCPLGDLKGYLRSCRAAGAVTPDPLVLQGMACEIASGLLHLHKNNFIHSDLALRNCLLTSEMTVKIGDYGLSHSRYKDDYFVTPDQIWVPLRWIAPELIDDVHGNLLVVDQTQISNVWSLGVTIWELFELGNQPYRLYSDRQVLTYAVKEQQLKLAKPLLKVPLADRWYEVMQFCWLQPEQRPSTEEVHLLLTYLCAKGSSEAEEDFEQRWNSLKPNLLGSALHAAIVPALTPPLGPAPTEPASSTSSSFPLLEHFSESFHADTGDDILTVTETSRGLNFEYKWEQARPEQPYCASSTSGPLGQGNPHYQDIYYPVVGGPSAGRKADGLARGASPSYYEADHPAVVPVLSAHSPSVGSEYYIRIEEPAECSISLEDSPGPEPSSRSPLSSCSRNGSPGTQPSAYWSAAVGPNGTPAEGCDSDASPTLSLTMEPLLRRAPSTGSPADRGPDHAYFSPGPRDGFYCEYSPPNNSRRQSPEDTPPEVRLSLNPATGWLDNPRALSQPVSSPSLGFCDPYLEASQGPGARSTLGEGYYDMMGPLRKSLPMASHITIDVETGDGLVVGRGRGAEDGDLFSEGEATNWTSNYSANNNSLALESGRTSDGYMDLYLAAPVPDATDLWPSAAVGASSALQGPRSLGYADAACHTVKPAELGAYIHLCRESRAEPGSPVPPCPPADAPRDVESLLSTISSLQAAGSPAEGSERKPYLFTGERLFSEPKMIPEAGYNKSPSTYLEPRPGPGGGQRQSDLWEVPSLLKDAKAPAEGSHGLGELRPANPDSSRGLGRGTEAGLSGDGGQSDREEDDIADITYGIFADFALDYGELEDMEELELSPLRRAARTPGASARTLELSSSVAGPGEQAFSPDPFNNAPLLPKSLDSGYDTENNESPEFLLKELAEGRAGEGSPGLSSETELVLHVEGHGSRGPHSRDSAYFSDYDAENDRSPQEGGGSRFFTETGHGGSAWHAGKTSASLAELRQAESVHRASGKPSKSGVALDLSKLGPLSMLSPFPQMGGCLTKGSAPGDGLALESEHSAEEPTSELSSYVESEPSTVQEASGHPEPEDRGTQDYSPVQSLGSDSTLTDCNEDGPKDREDVEASTEEEELPDFNPSQAEEEEEEEGKKPGRRINEEDFEDIDADEYDSQESLCEERNGPADALTSSASFLELCGEDLRAPLEEAEDGDESDDSESDEELRTYTVQDEDSEDSAEEAAVVPVVVGDCSQARNLRSLLKMPAPLGPPFGDEPEGRKKVVSFFDDVTVFLFDQESPTGELSDYAFPPGAEHISSHYRPTTYPRPHPKTKAPQKGSAAGTPSKEGNNPDKRSEREGDAPPVPSPTSAVDTPRPEPVSPLPSDDGSPPSSTAVSPLTPEALLPPSSPPPEVKPAVAVAQFSRFSVSRFSITQVSDSDVNLTGGSAENG